MLCEGSKHVVISEGGGKIVHAANRRDGVKEAREYFKGTVRRVKAFANSSSTSSSKSSSRGNSIVTDEFVDFIAQLEGFLPKATPKDGGIDIGYGFHNQYWDGTKYVKVRYGMTMTKEQAHKYFCENEL